MGALFSRIEPQTTADGAVIDWEDFVLTYAREVFNISQRPLRKIPASKLHFDINWDRVLFETKKPVYKDELTKTTDSIILANAKCTNDMKNKSQENEMTVEGKYTASTSVSLSQGFTVGEHTRVDLALPDKMLNVNSGFDTTLSIRKIGKETIKKEQKWSMTTRVQVEPKEQIMVEQTATVNQYSTNVSVKTLISGPVRVNVYKKTGGEKTFLKSLAPKALSEIITYVVTEKKLALPTFVEIDESRACVTSKGQCKFIYAVDQDVVTTRSTMNE